MICPGLNSVTFRKLAASRVLELAVAGGMKGLEWGGDIHVPTGDLENARRVGIATRDAGLEVVSYGSYYRAGESAAAGSGFPSVLETARALGAPNIRVWSGARGATEADPSYCRAVQEDLRRAAELAGTHGITVSCEFHDGTLTDAAASSLAVLQAVAHPNLRIYWQPRHGHTVESNLADLDTLSPWLSHLHVFHWWPTSQTRLPLEKGLDRWLQFLQRAAQISGPRFALLEFVRDDDPEVYLEDARSLLSLLAGL